MNLITGKNFLMKSMSLNSMKTNQDFKNEESAKQYSLLKKTINKPKRTIITTHIGVSDKAMAFKVTSPTISNYCMNEIPHITICTFNGGKPVESNNITKWYPLDTPIKIETKLEKR